MKIKNDNSDKNWSAILGGGMLLIFIFFTFRDAGLYASVFGDEWAYSSFSRLLPLSNSSIPSYLYLWLYRGTTQCGPEFLGCARVINAALFVASAPFLFSLFRRFTSSGKAVFFALLSIASPISIYAAYFMPEAMYFFAFWAFCYIALTRSMKRSWRYGAENGLILGLMCLVKVHALFLLGAFSAFLFLETMRIFTWSRGRSALVVLTTTVIAFFATRFGIGYLLAGPRSLSLFGDLYNNQAQTSSVGRSVNVLVHNALLSASGHLMGLVLLFGPLLVGLGATLLKKEDYPELIKSKRIASFTLAVLAVLLCVTAYFTSVVSSKPGGESALRLHMRYYDFCFPLLLLVNLAWRGADADQRWRRWLVGSIAIGMAVFMLLAASRGLPQFTPYLTDAPELAWSVDRRHLVVALALLGALACLNFLWRDFKRARSFGAIYHIVVMIVATTFAAKELQSRALLDNYVRAGELIRIAYSTEAKDTQLIGEDVFGLFKARFYIDSEASEVTVLPKGRKPNDILDRSKVLAVVFGEQELSQGSFLEEEAYHGFRIYRLKDDWNIDFRETALPSIVESVSGLSSSENFGRWSDAKEIIISFNKSLPQHFRLNLNGAAYGPNVSLPFIVEVNGERRIFTIGQIAQNYHFRFDNGAGTHSIRIIVPKPVSPRELGLSTDERRIGLALSQLSIERLLDGAP